MAAALAWTISMVVGGASYVVARRLAHGERDGSIITVLGLTLAIVLAVMALFVWRLGGG